MKVRKNCICVANFAQSKPSASPGSQNFAFPKIKEKEKFINPQRWPKVLIWKILPEQWLGVDRGTASR